MMESGEHTDRSANDQWYTKNPALLKAEISAMRHHFPQARYGFLKEGGYMFWGVSADIPCPGGSKKWTFLLVYEKEHPHKYKSMDSIVVFPKKPSFEELERMAKERGYSYLPHVVYTRKHRGYLSLPEFPDGGHYDVDTFKSAATCALLAVKWATIFEADFGDKPE